MANQIELNNINDIKESLELNNILSGIASIYKSMFIIDISNKSLIQVDSDPETKKILEEKTDYKEKFYHFLDEKIADEYKVLSDIYFNLDTLYKKFNNRDIVDYEILGKDVGWFRAQLIVINRDDDDKPNRLIFTTQIVDDEKKELDEQHRIIDKLADTFYTIHLFDMENDTCKEIDTVRIVHNIYKDSIIKGGQETIFDVMKSTVEADYVDIMLEFTDFSTLNKRMKGRKTIAIDFRGILTGWIKAQVIEYERNKEGNLSKFLFVTTVIDEEKRKEEALIKTSFTDELTRLSNRRAYEEAVDLLKKETNHLDYVIAAFDVNGLKDANDDIGHSAGDELLCGAAEVLNRCLGPFGKVYRVGGDEFNAIIHANAKEIIAIKKDLDRSMLEWSGKEIDHLSVSYGFVSSSEFPDYTVNQLEAVADHRMYESKEEYYRHGGQDRRGQKDAFDMICKSYIKILSVNLTRDSYRIIKTDAEEMSDEKGYSDESISKWLYEFANSGQVLAYDLENFLKRTSIDYLRSYFKKSSEDYAIHYRRKTEDGYKDVIMEMVRTDRFTMDNMEVFLYVKNISV